MHEPLSSFRLVYEKRVGSDIVQLAKRISNRLNEIGMVDHILIQYSTHRDVPYPYGVYIAFRKYAPQQLVAMLQQQDALDDGETLEYFQQQYPREDELQLSLEELIMTLLTDVIDDTDTHLENSTPEYFGQAASSQEWIITNIQRSGTYANGPADVATILREVSRNADYE